MSDRAESIKKPDHNHSDSGLSSYAITLSKICQEEGIKISSLSNGWVTLLEKNGQNRLIVGYKFGINSAASAMVADDKFATYDVLKKAGIPIIEHALLYEETRTESFTKKYCSREYIEDYLTQHENRIVIKANTGYCGLHVHQVHSMEQIDEVLPIVFHQCASASMCPFYDIQHEYRLIILDEEVRLAYQKNRGEDWRFNLHNGAKAEKIQDLVLLKKLSDLALRTVRELNLRFCSVDIIKTASDELLVMEVNSGVMTRGYVAQHPEDAQLVDNIYRDAIRKMFAEN